MADNQAEQKEQKPAQKSTKPQVGDIRGEGEARYKVRKVTPRGNVVTQVYRGK